MSKDRKDQKNIHHPLLATSPKITLKKFVNMTALHSVKQSEGF